MCASQLGASFEMEKVNQTLSKLKSSSCFRNASIASFLKDRSLYSNTISHNGFFEDKLEKARTLYQKDLTAHFGCVNALDFSQDGQYLISGGDDRRVILWSVNNNILGSSSSSLGPYVMDGQHTSNIFSLAFNASNSKIFSAGNDRRIIIHDVNTGRSLKSLNHEAVVYCVAVNPEQDSVFATAGESGKLQLFDTRESCSVYKKSLSTSSFCAFHSVQFHPLQPTLILSANYQEGVSLWDLRNNVSPVLKYGGRRQQMSAMSAAFSRNGSRVLALRRRQCPVVYNVDNTRPVLEVDAPYYYNTCTMKSGCFAGDRSQYIVSGSDDFNVYMWKIPDGASPSTPHRLSRPLVTLRGHRSIVNQVRSSSLGLIASSGVGKTVKVWSSLPLPGGCGTGEHLITRNLYSHTHYLQLIMQEEEENYDYNDGNTEEDPRMMAFFDSLVQREVNNGDYLTYDSETESSTETESSDDESDLTMTSSSIAVGVTKKFDPDILDLIRDKADPTNADGGSFKGSAHYEAKQSTYVNASSTSVASTSVILEGRDGTAATSPVLPPPYSTVSVTSSSGTFTTPDLLLPSTSATSNPSSLINTLSAANSSVLTASTSSSSQPLTCRERFTILKKIERLSRNRRQERRVIQQRRNQLDREWKRRFDSYLTLSEVLQLCATVGIDVDHMLDVHRQAGEAEALSTEWDYGADEVDDGQDTVEVPTASAAGEEEAIANVYRKLRESKEEDIERVGLRGFANRPTGVSGTSGSDSDSSDSSFHHGFQRDGNSRSDWQSDSEELSDDNIDDDDLKGVCIGSGVGRDNKSLSKGERAKSFHLKKTMKRHRSSNGSDNLKGSGGGPVPTSSNVLLRNSGKRKYNSSGGVFPSGEVSPDAAATESGVGADTKLTKEATGAASSSSVASSEKVSMHVGSEGTHGHSEAGASEECGAVTLQESRESASAPLAGTSGPPLASLASCIGHPAQGSETSSSGACDSSGGATAGSVQQRHAVVTIPGSIGGSSGSNTDQGLLRDSGPSHNDGDFLTDFNYTNNASSSRLTSSSSSSSTAVAGSSGSHVNAASSSSTAVAGSSGSHVNAASSSSTAVAGSSESHVNAASSSGVAATSSRSVNRASTTSSYTENDVLHYMLRGSQFPVGQRYSRNQLTVPLMLSRVLALRCRDAVNAGIHTIPDISYRSTLQLIAARRAQQLQRRKNRRLDRRLRRLASRMARRVMMRESVRYQKNQGLFARSRERRQRRVVQQDLLPRRAGLPRSINLTSRLLDLRGPLFNDRRAMQSSSRPLLAPYTLVESNDDPSDTSNIDDDDFLQMAMRCLSSDDESTGSVGDTASSRPGNLLDQVVVGKRKREDGADGDQAVHSQARRSMSRTETANEGSGSEGSAAATSSHAAATLSCAAATASRAAATSSYAAATSSRTVATSPHAAITSSHAAITSSHAAITSSHAAITSSHAAITSSHAAITSPHAAAAGADSVHEGITDESQTEGDGITEGPTVMRFRAMLTDNDASAAVQEEQHDGRPD